MTLFADFDLHQNTLKALEKMGFTTATEIQEQFIPAALKGDDVMASAQTGSGKTAAFLIPAFEKLFNNHQTKKSRMGQGPRVLVLTPTRELAAQVMEVANQLQAFSRLNIGSVTGGVSMHKQVNMFRKGVDVLVATPGRMVDLINRDIADLSQVEIFVLDEADRMLDMGFSKDVLTISNSTPKERQTMLLSATLDGKVGGMVKKVMNNPFNIELSHAQHRHDNIEQYLYLAKDKPHKTELLDALIEDNNIWQAVIFMKTKYSTEKMAKHLSQNGEMAIFIHGDMRQSARNNAIRKMQKGEVRFLIATDVAARGLDIDALTHVINFDLPQCPEDYTHRIGRVGRAGKKGVAISLVSNDQKAELADIEHLIGLKIEQRMMEGLEYTPKKGDKKPKDKPKGGARRGQAKKATGAPKQVSKKSRKKFDPTEEKKPFARKAKPTGSRGNDRFSSAEGEKKSFSKKAKPTGTRNGKKFDSSEGEKRSFSKRAKPAGNRSNDRFASSEGEKKPFTKKATRTTVSRGAKKFDTAGEGTAKKHKWNKTNKNKGKPIGKRASAPRPRRATR